MSCAPSPSIFVPTDEGRACNIGQRCRLAITQSYIDMLPSSTLAPPNQSRHNRIGCVQPRRKIRNSNTNLGWWAVSMSSDMHEAKLGFDHDIVPGAVAVWSVLTVACDAGVDNGGIDV